MFSVRPPHHYGATGATISAAATSALDLVAAAEPLSAVAAAGYSLAFSDLRVSVPRPCGDDESCCGSAAHASAGVDELEVLRGVDGALPSGELLCILGPSGAGKTTLLDVLAGRHKAGRVTGHISLYIMFVHPLQTSTHPDVWRSQIAFSGAPRTPLVQARTGYVMQDDALQPLLTVRETLMFSSRLRVPQEPGIDPAEDTRRREAKVDDIIRVLHLQRVADARIGSAEQRGLSGGERRRVSIGEQLVHSPLVLFCDEVTSGLDVANARRVVLALRGLARTGCTVVCTLHQPSSVVFALTDRLLLQQRGRAAYFGPTLASLAHFAALGLACPTFLNPADHLLDLVEDANGDGADGNANDRKDSDEQQRREADAMREIQERLNATATVSLTASANVLAPALPHAIPSAAAEAGGAGLSVTIGFSFSATTAVSASAAADTLASRRALIGDLAAAFDVSAARAASTTDIMCLAPALPVTGGGGRGGNAERSPCAAPSEFDATAHLVASSSNVSAVEGPMSMTTAVSEAERVRVLTHRAWLATVRDPAIMYFRTGAACGIAALIGIIFFQTTTSVVRALLFLMCVFSLFCLPAITRYTEDRLIYSREYAGGYSSPFAYSVSGFLVELPILMITVLIYGLIIYFLVGFRSGGLHFPAFLLIVFLVVNVCFAKAQMLSALASSTNAALAFFMLILVYSLLLGGFMISSAQLPNGIQWLVYTSYFYFGFNALLLNQYLGVPDPQQNLVNLGFQDDMLWVDFIALTLFLIGFRVIGFMALKYLHREQR